jgi:phospholipid/cholesterol/gamma-HCH transport system permease protein
MSSKQEPTLAIEPGTPSTARAAGAWNVLTLAQPGVMAQLRKRLQEVSRGKSVIWDLTSADSLDHIGAQLLWSAWGYARPADLRLAPAQEGMFERVAAAEHRLPPSPPGFRPWQGGARALAAAGAHLSDFVALIGQLVLDLAQFAANPLLGPWREISAHTYHIGYRALGITALVGFLIGVVLSYLSAQQLATLGADVFLVDILGMSIVRELGPMLAAILVAGRSGSAITAQLGVMRVTEELDAMLVMGMPHGFRLIMPRVLALAVVMPLLVIWTDAVALLGGMTAARIELGLTFTYFLQELPDAVPIANYWIGLGKGVVFGMLIALVACHFGLRIEANTESLGQGTTLSVVTAITAVILADAVFAIVFSGVGFY